VKAPTLSEFVAILESLYPPGWAEDWDAVGLVCGDPQVPVRRVLLAVDPVAATVGQAGELGADLLISHHPLFLRAVHGVPATTYKGKLTHRLITGGTALFVAHTNADIADPGVSGALAERFALRDLRPLRQIEVKPPDSALMSVPSGGADRLVNPAAGRHGLGRVGELPEPMTLREFLDLAGRVLPTTGAGLRAAGDPGRVIRTVAVCGGAGDGLLSDAVRAEADVYLTADLRHHPVLESLESGGPALVDAAHWATERPWLDQLAVTLRTWLRGRGGLPEDTVDVIVSDLVTDSWTLRSR
jgi:dinuclear metal center YbgI/SA1388 family protein